MHVFSARPASLAEKPVIAAMFQPYYAELSRFPAEPPLQHDGDGVYLKPYFDDYWREDVRYPYLLFAGYEVAGFAFVRRDGTAWDPAEFYVKPKFRRRGLGRACAKLLVERHPGGWRIRFNKANRAGRALWTSLADDLSGGNFERRSADAWYDCLEFRAAGNNE